MSDPAFASFSSKPFRVRDFRRVQIDLAGNKKVLLVSEFKEDGCGTPWYTYQEAIGSPLLVSSNGKLNYIQFLRELEKRDGRSV